MRRPGGNRNAERQGRGQSHQGSPMPPTGPQMEYQPQQHHQYHHHHHHHHHHQHHQHQHQHHHHHHHHHSSSYNNMYDGSRPLPHGMHSMPPHGLGQGGGGGGNGWSSPPQQMPVYNQGYDHMGPSGSGGGGGHGGHGDMGGVYPDMHPGQYPPSPLHMSGGPAMSYMRAPPMHGAVPPAGPIPGAYGGLQGQGTPLPVSYGRGGHPPVDTMHQSGMYGMPMVRHDGYQDSRLSPPPQVGYGPNVGGPPLPQGPPYGGGGTMPVSRSSGGVGVGGAYADSRGRGMTNNPVPPPNAGRPFRVGGSPDPGIMSASMPMGRYHPQSPMMTPPMAPPTNYIPGGSLPPNQASPVPASMDSGDFGNLGRFDMNPPTENLYDFLQERDLVSVDDIFTLFPTGYNPETDPPLKIAIDGNFCLSTLSDELRKKEPLWFLHSTLPEELLDLVGRHVEQMRSLHLEPIWVFNGLSVSGDVETFLTTESELRARDVVWSKLEEGEIPCEADIQTAFDQHLGEDVQMAVSRYLKKEFNVMAVTAPFLNWAQMVTFHKEGVVDLLMGPPEMLLLPYDEMKLIFRINIVKTHVYFLDRDRVLRALFPCHVKEDSTKNAGDRLMDLGLLTATHPALSSVRVSLNLTMQEIYEELSSDAPKFRSIKEFIVFNAMTQDMNRKKAGITIKHSKGRGYLRYSGVFSSKTRESPLVYFIRVLEPGLTNADIPSNLNGILGHPVPLSLFYLQFTGLLPVRIMTVITQSYLRDECPVSDTKDYHDKLGVLMMLQSQIIAQVSRKVVQDKNFGPTECLSWVRWFEPILAAMPRPKEIIDLVEWDVSNSEEVRQLDADHLEDYSIASVLTFSTEAVRLIKERTFCPPHQMPILYQGRKETFFAILLKTFDFLGYFSHVGPSPKVGEDGEMMVPEGGEGEGFEQVLNAEGNAVFVADSNMNNYEEVADSTADGGGEEYPVLCFPMFLMNAIKHNMHSFQNAFVILTELLRVGIIGSLPCQYIDPANQQQAIPMEDQESNCDPRVLLASRIACLTTVPYHREKEELPFVWTPVYSRHLCAFTVMVRAMCRCLRELVEVIATTVFLAGSSSCRLDDFAAFASMLPFGEVPSAIGGLLLHYVLVFPADYQANITTRQGRLEYLQEKFRDVPELGKYLRLVMTFTLQALYLINAYKVSDKEVIVPRDLLVGDTVECTIELLWGKWYEHIDDTPPEDIYGLYNASKAAEEDAC